MYEKHKDINMWLRSFMILPLVKHNALDTAIKFLIDNPPISSNLLAKLIQYFERQWITRTPPKYWNIGPIHLRCNNSVEGII